MGGNKCQIPPEHLRETPRPADGGRAKPYPGAARLTVTGWVDPIPAKDEMMARVSIPCESLGLVPPPAEVHLRFFRTSRGWMIDVWSRDELRGPLLAWLGDAVGVDPPEPLGEGGLLTVRLDSLPEPLEGLYDNVTVGVLVIQASGSVAVQLRGNRKQIREQLEALEATQELESLVEGEEEEEEEGEGVLTDEERKVMLAAYRAGYFEVPRELRLSDLADQLGRSQSALSTLIRRGLGRLVQSYVEERLDEELVGSPPRKMPEEATEEGGG